MPVSHRLLEMVKRWEGFRPKAYKDASGKWTVGYGFTAIGGKPVGPGTSVTKEQAESILKAELEWVQQAVRSMVKVPLRPHELDALTSFAYNVGLDNLRRSTLLKRLNAGDRRGAALEFSRWVYAGGEILLGLVRRRAEEALLFAGVLNGPSVASAR
jgi:lysozyme